MKLNVLLIAATILLFTACNPGKKEDVNSEIKIPFTIARVFPHDKKAFTQGLTVDNGRLFESTGQDGSWIAEVDIVTGKQNKKVELDKKYFGEGICILNNKIYELTWQSHVGFVYDLKSFEKKREFSYSYEGWGITHNGKNLIVSDGTDKIHFLDTVTLKDVSSVSVHDNTGPVKNINELEFINGFVYANQWQTNFILKINPENGAIEGKMDFSEIAEKMRIAAPNSDVLNGIAYEKKSKLLLITGKLWPNLFAVKLRE